MAGIAVCRATTIHDVWVNRDPSFCINNNGLHFQEEQTFLQSALSKETVGFAKEVFTDLDERLGSLEHRGAY
jgi:hypothetical protein